MYVHGCIFQGTVMQQQTIGELANSITRLWADNFCLQQWKNILKSDNIGESYAEMKGSSFVTHSVDP